MPALIPRRYWHWHTDLHHLMKETHSTEELFEGFKSSVRNHGRLLDRRKKRCDQDTEAWDRFLAGVLSEHPELELYQDFWPIQSYWESTTRKSYRAWMKALAPAPTGERNPSPEIENPFPQGSHVDQPTSTQAAGQLPQAEYGSVQASTSSTTQESTSFSSSQNSAASSSSSNAFASSSSTSPVARGGFEFEAESTTAIACCPLCGPPIFGHIEPWMNKELRRAIIDDNSLRRKLASIGILFDQHLDLLFKLTKNDWELFLASVPPSEMSADDKLLVFNALSEAASCSAHAGCIPAPPVLAELEIINPALEGSQLALQLAMGLRDREDVFQDLWGIMKVESRPFLLKAHPNIQDLANVLLNIIRERPQFDRYDNFWPIRLYLLRMKSLANVRPTYQTSDEQLLFLETFIEHRSDTLRLVTTTVTQIPCGKHNLLDLSLVQDSVQAELHIRGLGELIPVMPYLAVTNNSDLTDFAKYTDRQKDEVMDLIRGLTLTRFQRFILKNSFA